MLRKREGDPDTNAWLLLGDPNIGSSPPPGAKLNRYNLNPGTTKMNLCTYIPLYHIVKYSISSSSKAEMLPIQMQLNV